MKLGEILIPPATSFNGGAQAATGEGGELGGRPLKEADEKRDQTLKNEESIEKSNTQGGSE